MRARLARWWRKIWEAPDPWAQDEAELERFDALHPEWGKPIRLDQARYALESGLSEAVVRSAFPGEVDEALAQRAALAERAVLSEAVDKQESERAPRARL